MPQINICVNGRDYLLNCGEGEQGRLRKVTDYLSAQITHLDRVTKQSGDTNLMLTAALLASDEVLELREQIKILQQDVKEQQRLAQQTEQLAQQRISQNEKDLAAAFAKIAARLDHLAEKISEDGADARPIFAASGPAA